MRRCQPGGEGGDYHRQRQPGILGGADVGFLNRATAFEVREFARLAVSINHKIETLGKVVVAALNGFALGGGLEMAESCTIRIAGHTAQLGHPEVRIGSVAGLGGTRRLLRLVGKGRAAELLLARPDRYGR